MTCYRLDDWDSIPGWSKDFSTPRLTLGPTQPSVQWLLEVHNVEIKQLDCEAEH